MKILGALVIGVVIVIVAGVSGCDNGINSRGVHRERLEIIHAIYLGSDNGNMGIVKVRDCEYVLTPVHSGYQSIHAGDCRNPAHFGKVEKE